MAITRPWKHDLLRHIASLKDSPKSLFFCPSATPGAPYKRPRLSNSCCCCCGYHRATLPKPTNPTRLDDACTEATDALIVLYPARHERPRSGVAT